jgi:hypothetical protein
MDSRGRRIPKPTTKAAQQEHSGSIGGGSAVNPGASVAPGKGVRAPQGRGGRLVVRSVQKGVVPCCTGSPRTPLSMPQPPPHCRHAPRTMHTYHAHVAAGCPPRRKPIPPHTTAPTAPTLLSAPPTNLCCRNARPCTTLPLRCVLPAPCRHAPRTMHTYHVHAAAGWLPPRKPIPPHTTAPTAPTLLSAPPTNLCCRNACPCTTLPLRCVLPAPCRQCAIAR